MIDSHVTTGAFNSSRNGVTEFGHVIIVYRNPFSLHFINFGVEFSRRQDNVTSDVLACKTTLLASVMVYLDVPIVLTLLLSMK
jgi:hypothetical protein